MWDAREHRHPGRRESRRRVRQWRACDRSEQLGRLHHKLRTASSVVRAGRATFAAVSTGAEDTRSMCLP